MECDNRTAIKSLSKPIISNKLPKAFSQPNQLMKKQVQNDKQAANEFKLMRKLLSPIKIDSPEKPKKQNFHTPWHLPKCTVKIQEMITLQLLTPTCQTGIVRKVVHAPSLSLYALKELPVHNLGTRQLLLEYIRNWQKLQKRCPYLVSVNSTFWNSPEGYVSVVMEYLGGNSLGKVIECVGGLPEHLLRDICTRVLKALKYFHRKAGVHGGIDLSQILLTRKGKTKLSLGLAHKLELKTQQQILERKENGEDDIGDLGVTLILATVGGQEDLENYLCPACCVFHSLICSSEFAMLTRLSDEFKDFLCRATCYTKRESAEQLLSHEWISSSKVVGPDVSIKELLAICLQWNMPEDWGPSHKQLENLGSALSLVLPGCDTLPTLKDGIVHELAIELGLNKNLVQKHLEDVLSDNRSVA